MERLSPISGILLLIAAVSCLPGHRAAITPVSELCIERVNNNYLPLDSCLCTDNGKVVTYSFFAKDCMCSSGVLIICEHPQDWAVAVNGIPVRQHDRLHLHGDTDGCFFVDDRLQTGENSVTFSRMADTCVSPSAFLAGDFIVEPVPGGNWKLMPAKMLSLGSWTAQGLPFYTWEMSYSRMFEVPAKTGRRVLRLGRWKGRECEVRINGNLAGTVQPGIEELSIGPFETPGQIIIEVLCYGNGEADCGLYEEFTVA